MCIPLEVRVKNVKDIQINKSEFLRQQTDALQRINQNSWNCSSNKDLDPSVNFNRSSVQVKDHSTDLLLGSFVARVEDMQEGYRRAYLVDTAGRQLKPASLFLRIEKKNV